MFFVDARSGLGDEFFTDTAELAAHPGQIYFGKRIHELGKVFFGWVSDVVMTPVIEQNQFLLGGDLDTLHNPNFQQRGFLLDHHRDVVSRVDVKVLLRIAPDGKSYSTVFPRHPDVPHRPSTQQELRENYFTPPDGYVSLFSAHELHAVNPPPDDQNSIRYTAHWFGGKWSVEARTDMKEQFESGLKQPTPIVMPTESKIFMSLEQSDEVQ